MNKLQKIYIALVLAMPILAYLDYIFIGATSYVGYILVCTFELLLFGAGVYVGQRWAV